jgi:transposase-like protein
MESVKTDHELFDRRILIQPRYITSADLARELSVSEHTVRSWRKFRIITPKKFGRSVRWSLEEVLQELSKRS